METIGPWPRRFDVTIKATPKVGDVFWCAFHHEQHIHIPEMWKIRPALVVSRKNRLFGKVTVLPFSTSPKNENDRFALRYQLPGIERTGWILCDHPVTVATSRLTQYQGKSYKLDKEVLFEALTLMLAALATPTR